jgi:hypothetical protein
MKKYKDEFLFTFPSGTNIRNVWAYLKEKGLDVDYTMRGVIVKTFDGGSQAVTLINQSKDYGYSNIKQLHAKGTTIKEELVLVWVDDLEQFYQMPLSVWEKFQKDKMYSTLLDIGYSDYYSLEKNNDMKFSSSKTNEIDKLKNDLKKIKSVKMAKGGSIEKENAEMVLNNNKQISHHTKELASAVKGKKVPAWVVAKVNRSASDLSDATHYLEGSKFKTGGGVGDTIADRYARLTKKEAKRLDELSKKVRINEQTDEEDVEWDKLVHKYRGWEYKGYGKYAKGSTVKGNYFSELEANFSSTRRGGVKNYSVDIDLENGEQLRGGDLDFKDGNDALFLYERVKQKGEYQHEKIEDIQLIVNFKNGDYETVDIPTYAKGSTVKGGRDKRKTENWFIVINKGNSVNQDATNEGYFLTKEMAQEYIDRTSKIRNTSNYVIVGAKKKSELKELFDKYKYAKGGYVFKGDKYEYTPSIFTYTIGGL